MLKLPGGYTVSRSLATASLGVAVLGLPLCVHAQQATDVPAPALNPTATSWDLSYENWHLPGGGTMGMVGTNLLYDVAPHVKLGLGSYGAVRGDFGGFITLGFDGQVYERLGDSWTAHLGTFVGAGGGRSTASTYLQGGGLMLREDFGLEYETHGYGNFGVGASYVNFPSGQIHSWQPYVSYSYPFYSLLTSGWGSGSSGGGSAAGALFHGDREFGLVVEDYRLTSSSTNTSGQRSGRNMQLLGVAWQSYFDDNWFLRLEAEGAMGGQSNGYMQILMGGGYRLPLTPDVALKLYAEAGPAGGGSVDTGGGLLLQGGTALEVALSRRASLDLSLGALRAPSGHLDAYSAGLDLNYRFGLPEVSSPAPVSWDSLDGYDLSALRLRATSQTYFKGSSDWRTHSSGDTVSNLGPQIDYFVTPNWYLTGQGLAAYAGHAGAYMTGLVGAGAHLPLSDRWFLEGEALVGAAGGGGLAVGGGLIGQANASLGYQLTPALSVMATAGHVDALRSGNFHAYVAGLTLAYRFGVPTAQ